jgi:5-methylcytosine-specific restriction protein A
VKATLPSFRTPELRPPSRDASGGLFVGAVTMAKLRMLAPRIATLDTRRIKPPPKTADPELLTRDWKAMRERVIREAHGRCQAPGCGRADRRMYADHIVERRDGGAVFDRENLQCLCARHHTLKTNTERAKRIIG